MAANILLERERDQEYNAIKGYNGSTAVSITFAMHIQYIYI